MPSLNRASILIADDRDSGRYRLLLEAQAGPAEHAGTSITVHDISASGMLFEAGAGLEKDAEIALGIPGVGPVAASIVWTNGHFYGAQFASPLSPDRLKAALSESTVVWPNFAPNAVPDIDELRSQRVPSPATAEVVPLHAAGSTLASAEEKLPLGTRVRIIVGLSLGLWTAILGGAWLAFA